MKKYHVELAKSLYENMKHDYTLGLDAPIVRDSGSMVVLEFRRQRDARHYHIEVLRMLAARACGGVAPSIYCPSSVR